MRGSMSKKIVMLSNIVPDGVANIAAKARTGRSITHLCAYEFMVTAANRFDAKVSRNSAERGLWSGSYARGRRNDERLSMKRDIASRFNADEDTRLVKTSGWRVIGLCAFYVLLGALAAALSAAIGTLPYWIWSAR